MKHFGYIWRNVRRNRLRTFLTAASVALGCFLIVVMISFIQANEIVAEETKPFNRLITLSSQGFGSPVPISLVNELKGWDKDGVVAASPLSWFGGKVGEERATFAQFGVDAEQIFKIYEEQRVSPEQVEAFAKDRTACVIGRKLAGDLSLKIGDSLLLKGDIYPVDLDLKVAGIYDGPSTTDLRTVYFHWDYMEEALKASAMGTRMSGNAGAVAIRCATAADMPRVIQKLDGSTANSSNPTSTQDEQAFSRIFTEMLGDIKYYIYFVGVAVIFSLLCASGVAMAMAMRERTTEIAVLKAIGFGGGLVLFLVLAESVMVAMLGGLAGTLGTKGLTSLVDVTRFTGNMLPYFYIPWWVMGVGMAASALIGFLSGVVPAILAAKLPVVDGLRKVV